MIASLATLIPELCVSDLRHSLDFYVRQLDFPLLYQLPGEGYAFLALGGAQLMLETDPDGYPIRLAEHLGTRPLEP